MWLKKYYKNIISLIIFLAGLTYLFLNNEVQHLAQFDWRLGCALLLLNGIFYFLITIPQFYILRKINIPITLSQIFSLTIVTNFLNLLLPARGGVFVRGMVLLKNFNLKKRDYAAFSIFISLAGLFVLGAVGAGLFPFMRWNGSKPLFLLELGALILVFFGFFGLYSTKFMAKWSPKLELLYHEKTKWNLINKKDNFTVTCLFYFFSLLTYALRIYLMGVYFYLDLSFIDACALTSLLLLINTVPILPGNIGVKEASLSGLLALMGFNPQIGFYIAVIDRLLQILFLGVLGAYYSFKWNIWENPKASKRDPLVND
jgi:uncharacterized membrane protein YbhN (UPF0104 family)